MTGTTALAEFVDEALGIIRSLKTGCKGSPETPGWKESFERGLHTIKGNAGAFGFAELAERASRWLDLVRAEEKPGSGPAPAAGDAAGLLEFLVRAEQFLELVKDEETPPAGFFDGAPGGSPGDAGPGGAAAGAPPASDLESEIEAILAAAPMVTPRVDLFAKSGPAKAAPKTAGPPAPLPASRHVESRPDPASKKEAPLASGAIGYAFEAALAYETVRNLSIHYKADPRLSGLVGNLAEFFKSFSKWGVETRSVPVGEFLKEAVSSTQELAESIGIKLQCEVQGKSFSVLPGVGRLVRQLLREALRGLIANQERSLPPGSTVRIGIQSSPGYFTLRISGLPGAQKTSGRLHLYSLQERVEKAGVLVNQGETGSEVIIDVPDSLNSIEVLVLRARESVVGVPAHRVISIQGSEGLQAGRGNDWLDLGGERIHVADLSGGGKGKEKGLPVVVLRTEGRKIAVKVDEVLGKEEMPLQVSAHADWQSEVIGLCISPSDLRCLPLLRWSLH